MNKKRNERSASGENHENVYIRNKLEEPLTGSAPENLDSFYSFYSSTEKKTDREEVIYVLNAYVYVVHH